MEELGKVDRKPQNLSDKAYIHIKQAILDGTLAPGTRLVEEELGESMGISRSPVREALQRLSLEGLVEKDSSGSRVCEISSRKAEEIYDMRLLLETYGVKQALPNLVGSDFERLREICEEERRCIEQKKLRQLPELNEAFHMTLIERAENETLEEMAGMLFEKTRIYHTFAMGTLEEQKQSLNDHLRLVDELEQGDVERALAVVNTHYDRARDVYLFDSTSP